MMNYFYRLKNGAIINLAELVSVHVYNGMELVFNFKHNSNARMCVTYKNIQDLRDEMNTIFDIVQNI